MSECAAPGCLRATSSKGWCKVHAERVRRFGHPGRNPRPRRTMAERLWEKVDRSAGDDACWPWLGKVAREGYGRIRSGVKGEPTIGAHRAAWLLANPDVPAPETVDHLCHDPASCRGGATCPHRLCCNPAHLAPATVQENSAVGRQWTKRLLTECSHGHEYTESNTYWYVNSRTGRAYRTCRACGAINARRRRRMTSSGAAA